MTTRPAAALATVIGTVIGSVVGSVVGITIAVAPTAAAAGTLSVTANMACESWSSRIYCDSWHTGGIAPIQRQWYLNGVHVPAFDNDTSVNTSCHPGSSIHFRVVITASNGTAEVGRGVTCRTGPPR